ncbi:MAG: DUF4038 domain-containing protein [Armatimonadetes bacterium]|nr:DUF4038 domain-containing protein [Armatimonadota bacterium]
MRHAFAGPLRVLDRNPRYFTDDSGRAIYLTGSHTWAVMQDMWLETREPRRTDFEGFLRMCEDHGHNFMRFWQWMHTRNAAWSRTPTLFEPQPWERPGPELARDGRPKFDLTRWNEAYFARLRERIEAAMRHGIYCAVMMFEGWCIKCATPETDTWPYHPLHPDNNVNEITDDPVVANGRAWNVYSLACPQLLHWQKEFVKRVIDAVNDLDNVLYEICNEVPWTPDAMQWQDHLAAFIRQYEAGKPRQHPVGITAEGGEQDNAELFATCADWISPSNGRLFEYRYNPPVADASKVVINDTDHLWGHGCEVGWIWKSFTRGHNVIFMDPWEPIPDSLDWWQDGDVTRNQRHYYLWDAVRRNLGYTRRFAERMDLASCVPAPSLCTSTYCLANRGEEYLCFLPAGGYEGLDLWEAQGQFAVEWFDPATGRATEAGSIAGGCRQALGAWFEGPSVLYVKRTA